MRGCDWEGTGTLKMGLISTPLHFAGRLLGWLTVPVVLIAEIGMDILESDTGERIIGGKHVLCV